MRTYRSIAVVIAFLLGLMPLMASAEEELFDTKAAVQHVEKGISLLHAKKYNAAIEEFEQSIQIAPEAEAYYYLGYAYYLRGRNGDLENKALSRENFEKAYEIDPNFTPSRTRTAETMTRFLG